ncbi:zf-HC2 domain-containing protein [Caballeronia sp. SEWSISQ10-4 2]|uniref:anti-sigma factor family protein n=1 Tax=Caballeronia sp. SEWSISQ10-4 2 TaxID=2937438 RepID=UPI0026568A58|nr:zf-HC2 domain-containing protein [Caballeronia sp. SEWSISQ10-4 2]MDN7180953.1 zf-HC2 domain-containing protein [Caballeronia sp. SEWSISQ10-4 2]
MKTDDLLLMAYVDGELPPDECLEVEEHIRASTEAAELVALLRASRLDYKQAFATQKLPPVPDSLTRKIEAMARAHSNKSAAQGANDSSVPTPSVAITAAPVRSRLRSMPTWLAAACVAGAFCGGLFLRLGPLLNTGAPGSGSAAMANAGNLSPWVAAAVGYQKLYTRDTLAYVEDNPEASSKTVADIHRDDGLALRIPDLRSASLTFKSVQRLVFNHKPLVQIVYLPEKGPPIALCVMKDVKPDQAVAAQVVDTMHVVTWRQAELSYALIGKTEGVDLDALGKRISNREVDQLFSNATSVLMALAG